MASQDIADFEARLLQLEQVLARAVLGEFSRVDVCGNDDLSAVELGVNMVLESLELEISKQRQEIRALSTPVLKLWRDIIAMPIIGAIDSQRAQELSERLLAAIAAGQVRFAILDITGVELVDTHTANHLSKVVAAARLLGTRCILSGIQPDVALSLATLDVEFASMQTARNLEHALRLCLRATAADERRPTGAA